MFLQFKELQALLELRTTMHACNYSSFLSCICCKFSWDDFQILRMYYFRQIWNSKHENTTFIFVVVIIWPPWEHMWEESKTLWRLAVHRCPPSCASALHMNMSSPLVFPRLLNESEWDSLWIFTVQKREIHAVPSLNPWLRTKKSKVNLNPSKILMVFQPYFSPCPKTQLLSRRPQF